MTYPQTRSVLESSLNHFTSILFFFAFIRVEIPSITPIISSSHGADITSIVTTPTIFTAFAMMLKKFTQIPCNPPDQSIPSFALRIWSSASLFSVSAKSISMQRSATISRE